MGSEVWFSDHYICEMVTLQEERRNFLTFSVQGCKKAPPYFFYFFNLSLNGLKTQTKRKIRKEEEGKQNTGFK